MLTFYAPIKFVHILCVLASGGLFAMRGLLLLNEQAWAMSAPMRYLSYGIDSVLLIAALMLASMLPSAAFANGWLSVKLVLLVIYVVLGSFALKRARSLKGRWFSIFAALGIYFFMLSVARTHQPLGWFY
jgi:uncharacterized membrane protein SirB2